MHLTFKQAEAVCNKNGYKLKGLIGDGTYGKVFQATRVKDGTLVAIKTILLDV